ncbi:hypothetical protein [Massilia sp. S19_KUP03_FR1]|uniref:hypothetical protein n=1 Tax=Massilia sp. S19_KUP03_FR1 TaxID=3025503 RepID=UPI002FCD9F0C
MNARVEWLADDGALRHVLAQVLQSALFARAPRSCNLLAFLVGKKLAGKEYEITEHAIGVAVFRRDARDYDTALDPIVRVQMGRLRARLREYNAAQTRPGPRLTIPPGSYVPACTPAAAVSDRQRPLQLTPLRNLTGAHGTQAFVAGVDEELGYKLFDAFGALVQLPQQAPGWQSGNAPTRHRLEGSIRVERQHVRLSMRLVDTRDGDIAWLAQVDCNGEMDMALQEKLASAICVKFQHYLAAV